MKLEGASLVGAEKGVAGLDAHTTLLYWIWMVQYRTVLQGM
jgi:hypothetical protein